MQKRRATARRTYLLLIAFTSVSTLFVQRALAAPAQSEPTAQASNDYQRLYEFLAGYLARDLELQKLTITAQSKSLSLDSSRISNGIALSLSTGTITIRSAGDGTTVTLSPAATLALPQQNDSSVSVRMPLTVTNAPDAAKGTVVKNGTVELSTGIITGAAKTKRLAVLQAERALLEAERAAQDRALSAEKAFYSELKTLYGYAVTAITEKNDLFDANDSFRTVVVKGYATDSRQYRQSFLSLQSAVFDAVQAQRRLERGAANFARACGISYPQPLTTDASSFDEIELAYRAAIEFLPAAVPEVAALDVLSFPKEAYAATESALWAKRLAELKRDAAYELTLKATGSYTFNDTSAGSDTVGAGVALDWNGLTATAGVAVHTGTKLLDDGTAPDDDKSPVYTLSLGWTPNAQKQARISRAQDKLDMQLEEIAIQAAAESYESAVFDKQVSLRDLQWSRHFYTEELDMYTKLERDMKAWLDQGIITRASYFDTRDSRDKAQLNLLINAANFIIYNNETKLLFHQSGAGGAGDGSGTHTEAEE